MTDLGKIMVPLYKYKDWEGTAESLAETAGGLMQGENGFGEADFAPNERLVRDYVARGIVGKPERRGKEAILREPRRLTDPPSGPSTVPRALSSAPKLRPLPRA